MKKPFITFLWVIVLSGGLGILSSHFAGRGIAFQADTFTYLPMVQNGGAVSPPASCRTEEIEPNGAVQAVVNGPFCLNSTILGYMENPAPGDLDYYLLSLTVPDSLAITLSDIPNDSNYTLTFYNVATGTFLATDGSQNKVKRLEVPVGPGDYLISVAYDSGPGSAVPYKLYVQATNPTPTPSNTPTKTPTLTPTQSNLNVTITDVVLSGDNYVVTFTTTNFTPAQADNHVHFFYNTTPPSQAGVPGPGNWYVYTGSAPFDGMPVADRGVATEICALVAQVNHSVLPNTGNCVSIPSDTGQNSTSTPTATSVSSSTPTATSTTMATPTPTNTVTTDRVSITDISFTNENYSVAFTTTGFTPMMPGQHVHLFFNTTPPEDAGVPGPGNWYVVSGQSPYDNIPVSAAGSATQLCSLVANADHTVIQGTGNCVDLPTPIDTPTPTATATATATRTATPTLTPTATATDTGKRIEITNISLSNGDYIVTYQAFGYTPQLPGEHIHFFFNTVDPIDAGIPAPSSNWILYGGPSPFTQYSESDRGAATQMCALVANPDHSVIQDTGNCVNLPSSAQTNSLSVAVAFDLGAVDKNIEVCTIPSG